MSAYASIRLLNAIRQKSKSSLFSCFHGHYILLRLPPLPRNISGSGKNRRTHTVHYRNNETYLNQKLCLYSPPGRSLQPYNYLFPFALQLPTGLPSSFIGSVGKITYLVRANVHRAGLHLATKVTTPFSVVGIKDLNSLPHLQSPLSLENHKTFGILFWKSKPLSATITINKQAFVSGESVLVSGLIKNESDTKITHCELKIKKVVQYHARSKTRSDSTTVYKCSQPGIEKESESCWQNVPVFIPSLPPSGLDGCNIIHTQYFLEVRIVPPGMHFALELTFNITIGTIPFHRNTLPSYNAIQNTSNSAGYGPEKPPIPGMSSIPSAPSAAPSAGPSAAPSAAPSAPALPPYGDLQPTFGVYLGDSNEPPSYDSLFKGADDNEEHDDASRNYQPKYPSFNFPRD